MARRPHRSSWYCLEKTASVLYDVCHFKCLAMIFFKTHSWEKQEIKLLVAIAVILKPLLFTFFIYASYPKLCSHLIITCHTHPYIHTRAYIYSAKNALLTTGSVHPWRCRYTELTAPSKFSSNKQQTTAIKHKNTMKNKEEQGLLLVTRFL